MGVGGGQVEAGIWLGATSDALSDERIVLTVHLLCVFGHY